MKIENVSFLPPISDRLSDCASRLSETRNLLQDDEFLLNVSAVCDCLNSINETNRKACTEKLDQIIKMLNELSHEVSSIIKLENAWHTIFDDPLSLLKFK